MTRISIKFVARREHKTKVNVNTPFLKKEKSMLAQTEISICQKETTAARSALIMVRNHTGAFSIKKTRSL